MNRAASLLICFLGVSAPAAGQQLAPIDILALYDRIPVPPANVQEAYGRAGCSAAAGCDAGKAFEPIGRQLDQVAGQIEIALAAASRPATQVGGMSPAEIEKKMASLSQDEQIRFAMELSRQQASALNAGGNATESAAVNAALDELRRIKEVLGQEAIDGGPYFTDRNAALRAELERKHEEIGGWATSDQFKDAQGMPNADWDRAQVDAMEKHIAAEETYQQALLALYRQERARQKDRYSVFQERLAAIEYGADVRNQRNRLELIGMQKQMLRAAAHLLDASRTATADGARWWHSYLTMEQRNR